MRTAASYRWSLLGLLAVAACAGGCVERRMTVRSNPPGALVYVDDYEVGTTPCAVSFIYYGERKIRLVKDGYETLTLIQPIPPPWYELPGFDFFPENLVPGKIVDERFYDYTLQPQVVVPPEQLRDRAEALRHGVQATSFAPAQPIAPAVRINPPATSP